MNCFKVLSVLLKSIDSTGSSPFTLSLLQLDVILFSCDAGVGQLRVGRGFGIDGTASFNFLGAGTGFFLLILALL